MAFPCPYRPEDLPALLASQLSPFTMEIDLTKEQVKTTTWSMLKGLEHRFDNGSPDGPVYFTEDETVRADLKRQFEAEEEAEWTDLLFHASKKVSLPKSVTPEKQRKKKYRKTPPPKWLSRTYLASRDSSPCPSLSARSRSVSPLPVETSQ